MDTNTSNGHANQDSRGRFTKGNAAAVGRKKKHAEYVGKLRSAMLAAITPDGVLRVMSELESLAESGNVQAIKEYLDRAVGKPLPLDVVERIEAIEQALGIEVFGVDELN